jgi:hypothetical protein
MAGAKPSPTPSRCVGKDDLMSTQLLACSPRSFFKLCEGINAKREAKALCQTIVNEFDVRIVASSWRSGMCEDLMGSELMRITEVLAEAEFPDLLAIQGGDLCIPSSRPIDRNVKLPWSWFTGERDQEFQVISTGRFTAAIAEAQPIIEKRIEDPRNAIAHFDCFREVIAYAEKHSFPLFWSL